MNIGQVEKLMRIARYYGEEKQTCKLIEECGELISACSELLMLLTYREDSGKDADLQERMERVAAEFADVSNVGAQVIALFGLEQDFDYAKRAGIDKTIKRIEEERDGSDGSGDAG